MNNTIVIPTGYMGSGSSAVTDILSEIEGYDINNGTFEYVMLHCPDGMFDLEDKLLIGNNALRSDEAIHRFISCMSDLYYKDNYWVSGYRNLVSVDFFNYCIEFIEKLVDIEINDTYWYFQENPVNLKMKLKYCLRRLLAKVSFKKIILGCPKRYSKMMLSYPSDKLFYEAARNFLNKFYTALGIEKHNLVLDQFILPYNLFRINNYFDDNVKIFVVERDPRDVYLLNKYIWHPQGVAVPFPLNVSDFCKYYKKIRKSEKFVEDQRIMRLHFEDLVYNYDSSINVLYEFLGVNKDFHKYKKKYFNPEISVKNTHLFDMNLYWKEETNIIKKELGEYIYHYPESNIEHLSKDILF